MPEITWIKLKTDMFENEKIRLIEKHSNRDALLTCYFKMLFKSYRTKQRCIINVSYPDYSNVKFLSILLEKSESFVCQLIKTLSSLKLVTVERDVIHIQRPWTSSQEMRGSQQYKDWRNSVFKRDTYTCQRCGKRGSDLQAHHIKTFANYPDLRFTVSNGITLCIDCHKAVHKEMNING